MTEIELFSFLKTVPLCKRLKANQLLALGRLLTPAILKPSQVLFREGEAGDAFYLIQEGHLIVVKEIPGISVERMATLGPRDPVGHLCLIDREPRSATVITATPAKVLRGDKRAFDRCFSENDAMAYQFVDAIAQDLAQKLRTTNQHLFGLVACPAETSRRLRDLQVKVEAARERAMAGTRLIKTPIERQNLRRDYIF